MAKSPFQQFVETGVQFTEVSRKQAESFVRSLVKTGEVRTYGEVSAWATEQLRRELRQAGGTVCEGGTATYVINGSIQNIYVDEQWNLDGTMALDWFDDNYTAVTGSYRFGWLRRVA